MDWTFLNIGYFVGIAAAGLLAFDLARGSNMSFGLKAAAKMEEAEMDRVEENRKEETLAKKEEDAVEKEEHLIERVKEFSEQIKGHVKHEVAMFNEMTSLIQMLGSGKNADLPINPIIALCRQESGILNQVYSMIRESESISGKIMSSSTDSAKKLLRKASSVGRWRRDAEAEKVLSGATLQHEKMVEHWETLDKDLMLEVAGDEKRLVNQLRLARKKCHEAIDKNNDILKICEKINSVKGKDKIELWTKLRHETLQKIDLIDDIIIRMSLAIKEDSEINSALEKEISVTIAAEKVEETPTS